MNRKTSAPCPRRDKPVPVRMHYDVYEYVCVCLCCGNICFIFATDVFSEMKIMKINHQWFLPLFIPPRQFRVTNFTPIDRKKTMRRRDEASTRNRMRSHSIVQSFSTLNFCTNSPFFLNCKQNYDNICVYMTEYCA